MKSESGTSSPMQWINPAHFSRCHGKRRFHSMVLAERKAEQASLRTGDLILAYECCDCGRFHIGHADPSQTLARTPRIDHPCKQCGGAIPAFKKQRARFFQGVAVYCSDRCKKNAAKKRHKLGVEAVENT